MEGLWQGLQIAWNLNLQPLIVEGDSQILINMVTRIHNGSQARKIAPSWRLEARLNEIANKIDNARAISFKHTRREGNKIADLLANIGVETSTPLISGNTNTISNRQQLQECESLIQEEAAAPDAGSTSHSQGRATCHG